MHFELKYFFTLSADNNSSGLSETNIPGGLDNIRIHGSEWPHFDGLRECRAKKAFAAIVA